MKKIFLTAILVATTFMVSAQVKIRPGIKTGLNIANVSNSINEGTITDAKQDFYLGAYVNVKFSDFYQLQPEVVYSRQGFIVDGTTTFGRNLNSLDVELNYLSIGLANKLFVKNTGLHFIVGPTIDVKINNIPNYFNNYNYEETDDYTGVDFALFGGIGYEFPFGLGIEARYKQGFIDINGDNFNQSVAFNELNINQVFQLGVTYSFSF